MNKQKILDFEAIEDCFPEGATASAEGIVNVTPQWLHDFAYAIERRILAAQAESAEPVGTITVKNEFFDIKWHKTPSNGEYKLYLHRQP